MRFVTPYILKDRVKLLSATAIMVVLGSVASPVALAVTDTGQAEATIMSAAVPVLTPIEELNFGEIIATGAGNVVISTAGIPTLDLGLTHTPGSPHQQGVMRITGTPAALVEISIVGGPYVVDNGLGDTMPVAAFDIGAGAGLDHTVTIGGGATVDVNIGATLTVGAGQQAGAYTGTFSLSADYQ